MLTHIGVIVWCKCWVGGLQFAESDFPLMQFAIVPRASFAVGRLGVKCRLSINAGFLDKAKASFTEDVPLYWWEWKIQDRCGGVVVRSRGWG